MAAPEPDPSDEELAQRAASGSREAFEQLVERWGGPVVALLERRVGDGHRALDLAQDVWVGAFRGLATFDPARSFRSWLFGIAVHRVQDEGRRAERSRLVRLDDFRDEVEERDHEDHLADRRAIEAALSAVDEPFRTAIQLVDVTGLDYAEAAESLRCSVGTVKSRVHRGRLAFRDHWLRLTGERPAGLFAGERS